MSATTVCPYCRMPFDESNPPKIYCTACGVPHHEDCYQENGGCTVFGCARAPADDPKLQVSQSDLHAAAAAATGQPGSPVQSQLTASVPQLPSLYGGPLGLSQSPPAVTPGTAVIPGVSSLSAGSLAPAYGRPAYVGGRQPRSRTTYIVLGIFLGPLGVHNFYAGYTGRAIGQLCLSVLTIFYLAIISWIWAIVEICVVDKDGAGIQFS
ncbi:MAG TPA: NINE protein [Candidatus Angelobacter sp.]